MKNNIYILSDKKVKGAINLPVMQVEYINQDISFENYDAIVVTSKYAIQSLDFFDTTWQQIPIYAIAPQTAKVVNNLKGNLAFTGATNNGDDFALELIPQLKNKKILYLRGEKSVSSLVSILNQADISCEQLIVYQSRCKDKTQNKTLPKDSIIIFSSPSTVKCFLDNFIWDKSFKAIAFGKKTATYLPEYIVANISTQSSLKGCVQLANKLYS